MAYRFLLSVIFIFFAFTFGYNQEYVHRPDQEFGIQLLNEDDNSIAYNIDFVDYDGDGDEDIFLSSFTLIEPSGDLDLSNVIFFLQYQENIGTSTLPVFDTLTPIFEDFNISSGYFFPSFGDLNGDSKIDFVAMGEIEEYSEIQHLIFYLSSGESYEFKIELDFDLNSIPPLSTFFPVLSDLDQDGDLDLMLSGVWPEDYSDTTLINHVLYAKNIGNNQDPDFLGWFNNPYNIGLDSASGFMQLADIDGDNDLDVVSLANNDSIFSLIVKKNISNNFQKPQFGEEVIAPYGMPVATGDQQFVDFNLVDMDGDEDLDLLILEFGDGFNILYYENVQCTAIQSEINIELCEGESYEGYTTSGTYLDVFPVSENCDSIRTLILTVSPTYEGELGISLCTGTELIIGSQTITSSGSYVINLQTVKGCDSILIVNADFEDTEAPIYLNDNTLSTTSDFETYQWIDCNSDLVVDGANESSFVPDQTGNYAVKVISINGCEATSTCMNVVISSVTNLLSKSIHVFPNPTSDFLSIDNKSNYQIDHIRLIDFNGRIIKTIRDPVNNNIDLKLLAPGGYFIVIEVNGSIIAKKIVVL